MCVQWHVFPLHISLLCASVFFLDVQIDSGLRCTWMAKQTERNQYQCKWIPLLSWLEKLVCSHFHAQKHPWNSWSETDNQAQGNLCSVMFSCNCNHGSTVSLIEDIRTIYFSFPGQLTQQEKKRSFTNKLNVRSGFPSAEFLLWSTLFWKILGSSSLWISGRCKRRKSAKLLTK